MEQERFVYSQPVIEFATVAVETCLLLEKSGEARKPEFVKKALLILPLLYLKTWQLELKTDGEEENYIERFVTEEDYLYVKNRVEVLLGADDSFLEVFHPDMPYSDTPIASFISENLADIYQELKDFAANFQHGVEDVMLSALYVAAESFSEHWGQKLLNVLRALHALRVGEEFGREELPKPESGEFRTINRDTFLNFQMDEEEE